MLRFRLSCVFLELWATPMYAVIFTMNNTLSLQPADNVFVNAIVTYSHYKCDVVLVGIIRSWPQPQAQVVLVSCPSGGDTQEHLWRERNYGLLHVFVVVMSAESDRPPPCRLPKTSPINLTTIKSLSINAPTKCLFPGLT